jgi:AraC family transcriptional regulator
MSPVQKAVWYVESHWREAMTLEDVAQACHVSPYHLTRAFAASLGLSLMRYVRARRLSNAAKLLAQGARDILSVALDAGYGSHEAFTRAFRDQFNLTPEEVRAQGHFNNLQLTEPMTMNAPPETELAPPRFETTPGPVRFVGLSERYNCQAVDGIPDQWQRFAPHIGRIPGQKGMVAYGVCHNFDGEGFFEYVCAVEVTGPAEPPRGLISLEVGPQKYAVFTHRGHIAGIRFTFAAIWNTWFPESGHKAAPAATLERYGPEFNPATGLGGVEIWVPVVA